jgi:tripartite-type tricarboxylate transporter receptor subunit TctC
MPAAGNGLETIDIGGSAACRTGGAAPWHRRPPSRDRTYMKLPRRRFLQFAGAAAAVPVLSHRAAALEYPTRPLRWIVGFAPGGGADTVSRIMAQWLSARLGQSVVIENKPGAATNISIQAAIGAPPDGYTLLYIAASATVNVTLFDNLPFNLVRDIAPVSGLIDFPLVMIVSPAVPARTVAEFVAYAKANPGRISMASFGTGSTSHVAGELFKTMTGIRMVHVPYRGEALALTDMIAGQVEVMFATLTGSLAHIRSGALRLLAVAGKSRSEFVPDAPTIGESVPGYEANSWCGLGVPRGTPAEIIARLNTEINAGLADPATRARLAAVGTTPIFYTPDGFGAYVAQEVGKWGKVIKASGAKPD